MNKTFLTVDHAYDHGSKIELHFTGRVQSADLAEVVADLAQAYRADLVLVDARGADFQLPTTIEDQLQLMEYTPPVVAVTDAATWGDRYYEARSLLK